MTYREIIQRAKDEGRAIGHFNFSNLEGLQAVISAAEKASVPVIVGVSEGERDHMGEDQVVALVESLRKSASVPIFLNADHTYSLERAKRVVDLGFDSVVVDGSKMTFEENVAFAKEVVEYAAQKKPQMIIEGEIGFIGASSKILDEIPEGAAVEEDMLTTPEQARDFTEKTGVHMLAPAVGTIHGMVRSLPNPRIRFERVREISQASGLPLVLHGGSGSNKEDMAKAILAGVSVVHINTELRLAMKRGITDFLSDHPEEIAPYKYMRSGMQEMEKVAAEYLKLFSDPQAFLSTRQ